MLQDCPWHQSGREMRANCHIALGHINKAIYDLHNITKIDRDRPDIFFKISKLLYETGKAEKAKE